MPNIFLGTQVKSSDLEIKLRSRLLAGLDKRDIETENFDEAVRLTLGYKTLPDGSFAKATQQELFESLSPLEQANFNIFQKQVTDLESALAGTETEAQRQRSEQAADILQEELSRQGAALSRSNTERGLGGLVGKSTAAIQSIRGRQDSENLLRLRENESRKTLAADSVFKTSGLLSNLNARKRNALIAAPGRHDIGLGASLLSSASAADRANAKSVSGLGLLGGDFLKTFAAEGIDSGFGTAFKKLFT